MPAVLASGVGLVVSFRFRKEMRKTAYVPPVAEQLAALPADKVFLRGSDQPTATPDELLRAAQARTEVDEESLLRPSEPRKRPSSFALKGQICEDCSAANLD
jgi:hypothetical protein